MDRLKAKTKPLINSGESGTTVQSSYNADTGLLEQVNLSGDVTRTTYLGYDTLRRLTRKDMPEGVLAYTYSADNKVKGAKAYRRART